MEGTWLLKEQGRFVVELHFGRILPTAVVQGSSVLGPAEVGVGGAQVHPLF